MIKSRRAFTIVELMVVIVMLAVLTAAMAVSFTRTRAKVRYQNQVTEIMNMFQEARSLAQSNQLVEWDRPVYYAVYIRETFIQIRALTEMGSWPLIDRIYYDEDFYMEGNPVYNFFYIPPYGDLCFNPTCTSAAVSRQFTFSATGGLDFSTDFNVVQKGGFLEITSGSI